MKVQENKVGLKWNGTHQLLVYADNVNLLWDNTNTIKAETETSTDASRHIGLEVIAKKTKYMLLSHHQSMYVFYDILLFYDNVLYPSLDLLNLQ